MSSRRDLEPFFAPCEVTAYSGHRADERPSAFFLAGTIIDVLQLHMTRMEEDSRTRARRRFFVALGSDGREYQLRHDMETEEWFAAAGDRVEGPPGSEASFSHKRETP